MKDAAEAFEGDGCWVWAGSKNPQTGYGQLSAWESGKRVVLTAHRVSFKAFNGAIPEGMCVLHTCDNPACFNPAHLFIGTVKDNSEDMVRKGRWYGGDHATHWTQLRPERIPVGTRHHASKLTDDDVRAIRSSDATLQAMSDTFKVSKAALSDIRLRKTWKHVL